MKLYELEHFLCWSCTFGIAECITKKEVTKATLGMTSYLIISWCE